MLRDEHSRLALALGDGVVRLQAVIRRHLARSGVSLAAIRTLAALDGHGPRRVTDLAALEQVTQPSMSALVARLETQRLVARSSDASDARTVIVSITDAGRSVLAELVERRNRLLAERLAELAPEDREAVSRALPVLTRLVEALEESSQVAFRS